jgi:hypothetical protein
MSLVKIKAFSIDTTDLFTFANANITSNLVAGNANVSGVVNVTGNLSAGNVFAIQIGNSSSYIYGDGSNLTNVTAGTAKKIANGTSNVDIASSGGNVTIGVGGTGGIATFTTTGANITGYANITGNITAGNVNAGNLLTANYVAGTLTTAAQPNITSVGTLTGLTVNGDITSTGNLIVAGTTTYVNSTVTAIKDPIIELGDGANNAALTSDDGMDRGQLLHYYTGGATRDAFMGWKNSTGEFTFASNVTNSLNVVTVNTLGKIKAGDANLGNLVTSNYFTGNGSLLTSLNGANVTGQVGNALVAGTVYTAAQPNITSVGTLTSLVVGNATANSTFGNGTIVLTSAGNITGGNLVSASYLTGTLTTAAQPNITSVGTLLNTTLGSTNSFTGGNLVSATYIGGTLTTAAQPNVTSVGTLTGLTSGGTVNFTTSGNVSLGAVGNVKITGGTSGYVLTTDGTGNLTWALNGSGTGNANISGSNTQIFFNDNGSNTLGTSANLTFDKSTNTFSATNITGTLTTAAQPNITSTGTLTSLVVSGTTNLGAVGNVTITGGTNGYVLSTNGSGTLSWVAQKSLTSAVKEFTGDGTTVAFTLDVTPTSKNYTFVSVQGVMQPKSSYSTSGTTLTFSAAPPNTSLIEVTVLS